MQVKGPKASPCVEEEKKKIERKKQNKDEWNKDSGKKLEQHECE